MKGFTLLELIVVLAIIGILSYTAIPAYCNYTVPMRVAQTVANAEPIKIAVRQHYQKYKAMPELSVLAAKLDAHKKEYLESLGYVKYTANSAAIVYRFNQKLTNTSAVESASHKTLILRVIATNGILFWDCRGGDLPVKYRPRDCKLLETVK